MKKLLFISLLAFVGTTIIPTKAQELPPLDSQYTDTIHEYMPSTIQAPDGVDSQIIIAADNISQLATEGSTQGIVNFVLSHWVAVLFAVLAILEAIVRITPTSKDNSILNNLIQFIDQLIPNKRKEGGYWG